MRKRRRRSKKRKKRRSRRRRKSYFPEGRRWIEEKREKRNLVLKCAVIN